MNSIDGALTRIQEIAARIRQIQQLAVRPPDLPAQLSGGTAAPPQTAAPPAAPAGPANPTLTQAAASSSQPNVDPAQFQKLLDSLLAYQSTSGAATGAIGAGASGLPLGATGLDTLGLGGLGIGGAGASGSASGLASLGLPADLQSLLRPSASALAGQPSNAARLRGYQQELVNAIRDLAAAQTSPNTSLP